MLPLETVRSIVERTVEYGVRLAVAECEREHRRALICERASAYLLAHPDASANAVYRAVGRGFDKAVTLEAVRALRSAELIETTEHPSEGARTARAPVCESKPPTEAEA
jgi:hypothetical protein